MTSDRVPTRLGPLPADWNVMPLGTVTERTASPVEVESNGIYREIGIRSHGKGIFHKEPVRGETLGAKRVFRVVPGRLVFNIVFAWEGAVGVTSNRETGMIASHRFPMFGPTKPAQVDVEFLRRFFQSELGIRLLGDASPGGAGRNRTLNQKFTADIPIPVPPISEQTKIAAILSSVDDAINATQAVIDQLQVVMQATMAELLTRGLPGQHARFKQTEIGEIPEGWEVVPLSELCIRVTDGSHQAVKTSPTGEIPFLFVSCVRDGQIVWANAGRIPRSTYEDIARGREPRPGVILYTAVGSYGHAALVERGMSDFAFQRHIAYVLPNTARVHEPFLAFWLNGPWCRNHADRVAVGNAQKTVTLGKLREYPVPVPPREEQASIAGALRVLDARLRAENALLDQSRTVKSTLMSVLLTGEVRVKPDEEAA